MKRYTFNQLRNGCFSTRMSGHFSTTFAFPLALFVVFTLLVALNISGSSIAIYGTVSTEVEQNNEPLVGQVRPVRSDEWLVRTPWLINQAQTNYETRRTSGMGTHDVGIVGDLPTRDLDLLVKPHQILLLFVGVDRALSTEWWMWHLLLACGVYALLVVLTKKKLIPAIVSLLLLSSPSTQWWVAPGTFTTVGYGTLATSLFISSLESASKIRKYLLSILAGWLFACFASTLYIPWVITTAILVGFIVIAVVVDKILSLETLWAGIRGILMPSFITGALAILLFAIFYLRHNEAIAVISNTVYPGERASESGGGTPVEVLFGAPFDYLASRFQTAQVNGTNQSENSSGTFYFLPVLIGSIWFFLKKNRFKSKKDRNVFAGVLLVGIIFISWLVLPISTSVGQFLLLDRVPPIRVLPAMTLTSLVALGLFLANLMNSSEELPRKTVLSTVVIFAIVHIQVFQRYTINEETYEISQGLPIIFFLCLVLYVLFRKYLVTGTLLILSFGVLQFMQVNPLQKGVSSLLNNPVSHLVSKVAQQNPNLSTWFLFGGDSYVRGSLEASPVNFLSGVSRYPDHNFWKVLDPNQQFKSAWNRYGHIYVSAGALGSEPQISSNSPDTIQVKIDPCDSRLTTLRVDIIVTQDFEIGCHQLIESTYWGNSLIRIYKN